MNPILNPQQSNPNMDSFLQQLNQLKQRGGDPNQQIQQLLNSGRVSQQQYNVAVQQAQQIIRMMGGK